MWRKATKNGDLSALDNQSRVNFLLPLALAEIEFDLPLGELYEAVEFYPEPAEDD